MSGMPTPLRVLCGSQSRARLFRALYGSPGKEYHLRGLAEAAGVDPAQVHRLLPQLVGAGLCERLEGSPHPRYRSSANHSLSRTLTELFCAEDGSAAAARSPRRAEDRSLALHAAAVRRLREDPHALRRARETLARWIARYQDEPPAALVEWDEIMSLPLERISKLALEKSERGDRIRKSSPLSTLVPREERRRIHAAH